MLFNFKAGLLETIIQEIWIKRITNPIITKIHQAHLTFSFHIQIMYVTELTVFEIILVK